MKKLFVIGIVMLMLAMMAVPGVRASSRQSFYLEKICPSLSNPTNGCDIVYADDPFTQLIGGVILYTDRVYWENPAGHLLEIARIEISTGDGSGSAIGQIRWLSDSGLFTIMSGTGSLAGLHANGKIEFKKVAPDGRWLFSLAGTYHIDPGEK